MPELPEVETTVRGLERVLKGRRVSRVEARRPEVDLGSDADDTALLPEQTTLFTARIDPRSSARQGATLTLAVDPAAFHFFDVETGAALAAEPETAVDTEQVPVASAENWS